MITPLEIIEATYTQAPVTDQHRIREWARRLLKNHQTSTGKRAAKMKARIQELPASMESLAVAKILKDEGFYSGATYLGDIARSVERIRRTAW